MSLLGTEGREQMKVAGRVSAVGIELALATMLGYFGGRWLDDRLGTTPWFGFLGLALGLVAGFRGLYRIARRTKKDLDSPRDH